MSPAQALFAAHVFETSAILPGTASFLRGGAGPSVRPLRQPWFQGVPDKFSTQGASPEVLQALVRDLREGAVATVKIDTQKKFLDPAFQANPYFRFPEADRVYGEILGVLAEYAPQLKMPAIEVQFIDLRSKDLKPTDEAAQNIPGADLASRWKAPLFTLESRSILEARRTKDVPESAEIRSMVAEGRPIRLEKNHRNLMKYARRYYGRIRRTLINRFRWAGLKPHVPFVKNERNYRFFENLQDAGIKTIVLYGVYTDYCVNAALGELKNMGFNVLVLRDGVRPDKVDTLQKPLHRLGRVTLANGQTKYPYVDAQTVTLKQLKRACKIAAQPE